MYTRTEIREFYLPLAVLAFAALWGFVFLVLPIRSPPTHPSGLVTELSAADSAFAQSIVGFWVIPLTEPWDPQNANLRTVQEFEVGGRGNIYLYANSECRKIVQTFPFSWSIRNGFLNYQVQGGQPSRDKIGRLDADSLILQPDGGGETSRVRGTSCARPGSF